MKISKQRRCQLRAALTKLQMQIADARTELLTGRQSPIATRWQSWQDCPSSPTAAPTTVAMTPGPSPVQPCGASSELNRCGSRCPQLFWVYSTTVNLLLPPKCISRVWPAGQRTQYAYSHSTTSSPRCFKTEKTALPLQHYGSHALGTHLEENSRGPWQHTQQCFSLTTKGPIEPGWRCLEFVLILTTRLYLISGQYAAME